MPVYACCYDKGGRISSVLDVNQKVPYKEKLGFSTSLGPVTSKIFVDLPIRGGKSGLILAARGAYPNYILSSFPDESTVSKNKASYYDLNFKYDHELNGGSVVTLDGYYSYDDFTLSPDTAFNYSNLLINSSYSHAISENLALGFRASYSGYQAGIRDHSINQDSDFENGIAQSSFKGILNYVKDRGTYSTGFEINHYNFTTGSIRPTSLNSEISHLRLPDPKALDLSVFLSTEYKFTEGLALQAGIRSTTFYNIGPDQYFKFAEGGAGPRQPFPILFP